jgi:hypothetical protein
MNEPASTATTARKNTSPSIDEARADLLKFFAEQRDDALSVRHRNGTASRSPSTSTAGSSTENGFNWGALVEAGLSSWWREHPLHAGALLVKSATVEIAQRKPLQLVAVAAVAGAAIVLLRPWRLVSASALALSVWRSSNFSGMTSDVLQSAVESLQKTKL